MKKGATLSFPEEPLSPLISRRGERDLFKEKQKTKTRKKGPRKNRGKELDKSGASVNGESTKYVGTYLALRGLLPRSVLWLAVRVRC